MILRLFSTLVFSSLCLMALAQPGIPGGPGPGVGELPEQEPRDTVPPVVRFKNSPFEQQAFSDTTIDYQFMQYDPARREPLEWVHLGNLGSAVRPIVFTPVRKTGYDLGLHAYDLYYKTLDDIRPLEVNQPYTRLFFTQGRGQENAMFKGTFSRNFAGGFKTYLDYQRINQQGIYRHQKNRNTALATTVLYTTPRRKADIYVSYSYNKISAEDNGGVINLEAFQINQGNETVGQNKEVVEIFSDHALTQQRDNAVELKVDYYLGLVPEDTTRELERNHLVETTVSYRSQDFLAYELASSLDSSYYGGFAFDDRGLRRYLSQVTVHGGVSYSVRLNDSTYHLPFFQVGLYTDLHRIRSDINSFNINNLYIKGSLNKKLWPGADIRATLSSYFANNAGDLNLQGALRQRIRQNIFMGKVQLQRFSPTQMERNLILNGQDFYTQIFKNPTNFLVHGSWSNEKHHWNVGLNSHVLGNWIFFDEARMPQQLEQSEIVLSLFATKDFVWRKLRTHHSVYFQQASNEAIPLPSLYTRNGIYLSTALFKQVLLFQPGIDLRWNSSYFAPSYFSILGQFHNQTSYEIGNRWLIDVFANFKVSSFRAFVKMENVLQLIDPNQLYFQHPLYPYLDPTFRIGIDWVIRN